MTVHSLNNIGTIQLLTGRPEGWTRLSRSLALATELGAPVAVVALGRGRVALPDGLTSLAAAEATAGATAARATTARSRTSTPC